VKVNATGDSPGRSDDLLRVIQADVSTWTPERGPRWAELWESVRERPRQVFRVYAFAGVALVVILVGAFVAMNVLDIGSLAAQPVISHAASGR
jgi:hypothetical protein